MKLAIRNFGPITITYPSGKLKIVKDPLFEEKFNHIELSALRSFKNVTQDFLGNKKAENYEEIIKELITYYCKMGCRMSLKIHSSTLT
jgi:hypothetical protein